MSGNSGHRAPKKPAPRPPAMAQRLIRATTRLDFLREAARQAVEMYAEARQAESYIAAEKCLATAQRLRAEASTLEEALLAGQAPGTEEQFLAELDDRLTQLPTPYLERAVSEYLRRHPGLELRGPG